MTALFASNVASLFHKRVEESQNKVALRRKRRGVWVSHTWQHVEKKVSEIAYALNRAGLKHGDRVVIFSQTRIEWTLCDWAILSLGAVVVPVYPSQSPDDLDFILQSCQASVVFFEDRIQHAKLLAISHRIPFVKKLISFEEVNSAELSVEAYDTWVKQNAPGQAEFESWQGEWRKLAEQISPNDTLSLLYTSGTTGQPKGVVLSHANFMTSLKDSVAVGIAEENDSTLMFLPLSHILGRLEEMLALAVGWRINYAQNFSTLFEDLMESSPTVLFAVPRVFDQMYFKVQKSILEESLANRVLMLSFFKSLQKYSASFESGDRLGWLSRLSLKALDRILFKSMRAKFGGNIRFCLCGGAPLSPDVARFFHVAGIRILEGYGLTETTGPIAVNRPHEFKFGSVGRPFPSVSLKIASDGEILIKGPAVMKEYLGVNSVDEKCFEADYFKTGDIGRLDTDGYLYITDRKKDIIISSGGKNISPQKIETALKADPMISHSLIAGDGRNYIVALFTLNSQIAADFARKQGIQFQSVEALYQSSIFKKALSRRIEKVNQGLGAYENVRRFAILGRDFSVEAGELTPSFKIRRKFCLKKFAKTIEQLYD